MNLRSLCAFTIILSATFTGYAKDNESHTSHWLAPITSLAKISQSLGTTSITPLVIIINGGQSSFIAGFEEANSVEDVLSSSKKTDLDLAPNEVLTMLGFSNQAQSRIMPDLQDSSLLILIEYNASACSNCKSRINSLTQLNDDYSVMSYQINPTVAELSEH